MDCPNCGVYNPEDRKVCWRCDKPLPKPVTRRRRGAHRSSQIWLYLAIAVAVVISLLRVCGDTLPAGL
jgi:predicted nucleic acid-binding Zn ribbon protein